MHKNKQELELMGAGQRDKVKNMLADGSGMVALFRLSKVFWVWSLSLDCQAICVAIRVAWCVDPAYM